MNNPGYYTQEELKKDDIAIRRLLCYSEEEWDAIQNPELMTQKLFNQCLSTSIHINDYDIFMRLSESFPDFFNTMFSKVESHFSKPDSNLAEITQAKMDAGIERLCTAIRKLKQKDSDNSI